MKKYEPLGAYLRALPASQQSVTLTFAQIEKIIGSKLASSAYKHRQWWANQDYGSRAYHWRDAGFRTGKVDQKKQIAPFHRLTPAQQQTASEPGAAAEKELETALLEIYERAKNEAGVTAVRFKPFVRKHGAWRAARKLLEPRGGGGTPTGFDGIMDAGRPDLSLEAVVLQERFREYFSGEEREAARARLGRLENPSITEVVDATEEQAEDHPFGALQDIRKRLRGRSGQNKLFNAPPDGRRYTFHAGGRTELQFNVGFETLDDGKEYLRHGVAISLKRDASFHAIDKTMLERIARLNEFIEERADEYPRFVMYHQMDGSEDWSRDYSLRPVAPELVTLGMFIFIGRRQDPAGVSIELILRDFDRLLPMYEFAESGTEEGVATPPDEWMPGRTKKRSRTTMSTPARVLDKDLRHNDIQDALGAYLEDRHGKKNVRDECPSGNGTKIDLVVKKGERRVYYEIKVAANAQGCIRQALGQLLEYSYWPGARRAERLVVVGEPERDARADAYVKDLRKLFKLPIEYQQFDMEKGKLIQ